MTVVTLPTGRLLDLTTCGLAYLATPYSKYPEGLDSAFREASRIAARLLIKGVKIYSPIAHTHPLAVYGCLDPLDHKIWLPFDEAMMEASRVLIVAEMRTWQLSYGVSHEIKYFSERGKPVVYLDPRFSMKFSATPCASAEASA